MGEDQESLLSGRSFTLTRLSISLRPLAPPLQHPHAPGIVRHPQRRDGRDDGGRSVASGAYFVRVEHDDGSATRKVVLLN